jgi:hypothetical protein
VAQFSLGASSISQRVADCPDDHDGGGRARVDMAERALAEPRGAALAGDHVLGGLGALLGGRKGGVEHLAERLAPGLRGLRGAGGLGGRCPGVDHGLLADLGLAAVLDALGHGLERGDEIRRVECGLALDGRARPHEGRRIERPRRGADRVEEGFGGRVEHGGRVAGGRVERGQRLAHRAEAERHGDAVVGVADHPVERAQPVALAVDPVGDCREHGDEPCAIDSCHAVLLSPPGT